jgi:hypothetical protein
MATLGERLATIEQIARDAGHRLSALEDQYDGGGDVEYARSVRGRLHTLEATVAGMVLRRNFGHSLGSGWVRAILVLAAVGTCAAAWYAALAN